MHLHLTSINHLVNHVTDKHKNISNRAIPDFVSGSGKSRIRLFFGNPVKSGSGQISRQVCQNWQTKVQLQYLQLIMDKTNAADLSSDVFTILISVIQMKNTNFIAIPQISSKTGKQWHNNRSTELHWLFIAADSIADAISFIRCIVLSLWSEIQLSPDPGPARFELLNPARSSSGRIWNSQIWYSPSF